ncbi:MAG: MFS transporter, partial [Ilumatobacteraceae bacterium]
MTLLVMVLATMIEQLSRQAITVLGPDIEDTFHISDTKLIGLAAFGGVAHVLGAVPMAWLADRVRRKYIVVTSLAVAAGAFVLTGLAANTFQLFWGLAALGFASAYSNPVFGSLISDQYPLEGRGRIFAIYALATPIGLAIGPFVAGSIADMAGGSEGWRWVYIVIAIATAVLAVAAGPLLREPPRGQFEQKFVLGDVIDRRDAPNELPIT